MSNHPRAFWAVQSAKVLNLETGETSDISHAGDILPFPSAQEDVVYDVTDILKQTFVLKAKLTPQQSWSFWAMLYARPHQLKFEYRDGWNTRIWKGKRS